MDPGPGSRAFRRSDRDRRLPRRGARFEEALASFAEAYADQNEHDYRAFAAAVESGRIEAELGV
jgi:Uncharacterized protein conserved in bacteria (DUF2252)